MSNPICSCINISPPPSSGCDNNCIYTPNLLSSNQVIACSTTPFDIDINPIIVACDTTANYSIISYKNVTGAPTISPTKITFVPANNDYASAEIVYRVSCGIRSSVGKIIIVYKNECIDVVCNSSQKCNKCTGVCEDLPGNLSISKTAKTVSLNNGIKIG